MIIINKDNLDNIISKLNSAGYRVYGPVGEDDFSYYGEVDTAEKINFDLILPKIPLKSLFFPKTEKILQFEIKKQDVNVKNTSPNDEKRIIFTKPCDAISLWILDSLFSWDYHDTHWLKRRENSTIVSIACTQKDEFCMCNSIGFAPDSSIGADILLRPLTDKTGWTIQIITEKGQKVIDTIKSDLIEESSPNITPPVKLEKKFDIDKITNWLAQSENFTSNLWKDVSERCLSCGICTYLCPTCHCFDIQDEGDIQTGLRRKNWDSCSFPLFTLHTSGHNPRSTKYARWRQRIMHKFNYYPQKFSKISCSGCGRCARFCPVNMGITETLRLINSSD